MGLSLKSHVYENSSDENKIKLKKDLIKMKLKQSLSHKSKENKIPSTKFSRLINYGSLAAGLGVGALAEIARRKLGIDNTDGDSRITPENIFLNESNAERIVETLCKVRGAALKFGQMLSIQDNTFISPQLQEIFERVRQGADFMPPSQTQKVLESEMGPEWRKKFTSFDNKPFAAASIGQVHEALSLPNNPSLATLGIDEPTQLAVKIQYPGIAESIDSDVDNLLALLEYTNILPAGLFLDYSLEVFRKELHLEVDYLREANSSEKFRLELLPNDPFFTVPAIVKELSTRKVLTSQLMKGMSLDKTLDLDQAIRNDIGRNILNLCLREVFEFRFMQTDPNWSNFLYDPETHRVALLDFGACRQFDKKFVDIYLRLIKASAQADRASILRLSEELGFLTGHETKIMQESHVEAVLILGEAFATDKEFDFSNHNVTRRIQNLMPILLKHRLKAPPEESLSLHRKMAGAFLICSKLGVKIHCKDLFDRIYESYSYETNSL
ncbi:unnamed protein product [Gordionus sp. m RMFG-2023]